MSHDVDSYKEYKCITEKDIRSDKWITKSYLKNGLIIKRKSYFGCELRGVWKFYYDNYNNLVKEVDTYDINDGKVNRVKTYILTYTDSLLTKWEQDGVEVVEEYHNHNKLGKPLLITSFSRYFHSSKTLEYDQNQNIIKKTDTTTYYDNPENDIEIRVTTYRYNKFNDVIEIHRKIKTGQKLPIIIGGYQELDHEYYKYEYNENEHWTKKYMFIDDEMRLIITRKYK